MKRILVAFLVMVCLASSAFSQEGLQRLARYTTAVPDGQTVTAVAEFSTARFTSLIIVVKSTETLTLRCYQGFTPGTLEMQIDPVTVTGGGEGSGKAIMVPIVSRLSKITLQNASGNSATPSLEVYGSTATATTSANAASTSFTVSGTVAATQSGTWDIGDITGTVPLPTGASTAAKQPALGTAGTASADVITVQGIAGGTSIPVSQSGSWTLATVTDVTNPVTVTQATASNLKTLSTITDGTTSVGVVASNGALKVDQPSGSRWSVVPYDSSGVELTNNTTPGGADVGVVVRNIPTGTYSVAGLAADGAAASGNPVPTAGVDGSGNTQTLLVDTGGRLATNLGMYGGSAVGAGNALHVQSGTGATFSPAKGATATTSSVADNAASVQLIAANANRLGLTITNDSSAALYIKLGTTASTTDYTVRLVQYGTYEVPGPYIYTGRVDGIWASDPGDGAARVTEVTP